MNNKRYPEARKDSKGRPLCRGCGKIVKKPRRTWCSNECYELYNNFRSKTYERDKGICQICGKFMKLPYPEHPWTLPDDAVIDHIVPLANGGKHSYENMQLLCVNCHKIKTSKEASNRKRKRTKQKYLL